MLIIDIVDKLREKFLKYLKKNKINAVISYTPLHRSKFGKKYFINQEKLINTDRYLEKIVRLPLHNDLTLKSTNYISNKIKEYFKN